MDKSDKRVVALIKKYPILFKECGGIECGNGWLELISLVCKAFQSRIQNKELTSIYFTQIKEKFGFLRIYFTYKKSITKIIKNQEKENQLFWELHTFISSIEAVSGMVCENCGQIRNANLKVETKPRHGKQGGWIVTLCENCRKEEEK